MKDEYLSQQDPPGGPAFPVSIPGSGDNGWHGMSLRDWFAGQALPVVMAYWASASATVHDYEIRGLFGRDASGIRNDQIWAALAYRVADEMLARRKRRSEQ